MDSVRSRTWPHIASLAEEIKTRCLTALGSELLTLSGPYHIM